MNHCLLCHGELEPVLSWQSFFGEKEPLKICEECSADFELITGEVCEICGRPFAFLETEFRSANVCLDCRRWEVDEYWSGSLDRNRSLYRYTDFTKGVIAKFKFRGDYILASVFAADFRQALQDFQYDYIVPIPLSEERLFERGFNQAEALITTAGFNPTHLLSRIHTEKQSKKSRSERIHLKQVFKLETELNLHSKTILLIDDIYTTGSTLRHAAKILKDNGAAKVYSFTLAR
ncbi:MULTISPECIES: ComF family protein [unclassified Mesobacillus]|uniref:ComF family protein n=1 Tax=unclassified Mesobacillus TaxID=2675270 RepID=UPI00203E060A|nr:MULTISPECIES: ComF family protein [unclassified Mesobacillus]MCM3124137.1 ComF family protein [Mesobacillus sp. MER 33]MCM3233986.1 ComF family protein [Mesobacillus sp. MER 48]